MGHRMKKLQGMGESMVKSASKMMHRTPEEESALSVVDQVFIAAQAVFDAAGRKFHQDATPHLKASKAHLAKAKETFDKAFLVHKKKMNG